MARVSKRAASNKRLEALLRAQKITEILKAGGVQSQALLDSAGETRPSDESHVTDLLENERFTRSELSRARAPARRASMRRARPRPARRVKARRRRRKRR